MAPSADGIEERDSFRVPQTPFTEDHSMSIDKIFEASGSPTFDKLENFPKYVRRQKIARFLCQFEIFKRQLNVKGSIVECGVHNGPLVVSCGTQQSESLVVVGPGGYVGRLPLGLSTYPRGCSQESGIERWSGGAVHQRVGPAVAVGG
jgi:hypothetical protein